MEPDDVLRAIHSAIRQSSAEEPHKAELGSGVDGQLQLQLTMRDGSEWVLDGESILSVDD